MATLRTRLLLVSLCSAAAIAAFGACSGLKSGEGSGDDSGTPSPSTTTSALLPDGALLDGAAPPTPDAESQTETGPVDAGQVDAQFQFDGGIVPRPTCVGVGAGTSESWVPNAGCRTGPGPCTFSKVTRVCKNGNCQKGLCQDLDFTAEAPSNPGKFAYQVWGAAPDAIWAVGYGVHFWNGATWTAVDIGITLDTSTQAYAVAGTTREDVTILTGNHTTGPMTLRRRDSGGVFRAVGQINDRVWGGGLFALGQNRFLVHLGPKGAYLATPGSVSFLGLLYGFAGGQHYTNALSGFKADDVLVASNGLDGTLFYDGTELKKYGAPAHAILYVPDAIAAMSVGAKVNIYNPASGAPIGPQVDLAVELAATGTVWKGLDGTSLDRIFVCDADGIVGHRNATGWKRETIPTPMQMNSVFASPWGDVYVAGSRVWHGK